MLLYIFEGLALIIFGIRFLRKGLDRLFGSRLSLWLVSMTKNRWEAFGAGIAAGTVAPSSTALSVLSLQMLHTGRLDPQRMLAVLLGGGVGMTITVQLLASGVTNASGYLLISGVIGFQFFHREIYRGVGQCLFALGLLFLGLHEIGQAASSMANDQRTRDLLAMTFNSPGLTLVTASLLAVLLQSSTATIGLALGLMAGGVFPPSTMVPWVVGTNIGVSLTSLLVGWRSWDGRRLGAASLFARAVVAMPAFLLAGWLTATAADLPFSPSRQLVLMQTGFNLVVGLFAVPFLGPLTRVIDFLVAPQPGDEIEKPDIFLDRKALDSPSLALAQATRQTLLMADQIGSMLSQYWNAEKTRNTDLAKRIQHEENKIDEFNTASAIT